MGTQILNGCDIFSKFCLRNLVPPLGNSCGSLPPQFFDLGLYQLIITLAYIHKVTS